MYHHSYRGVDFQLDKKNYDELLSTSKREAFSGLRDLKFCFINKGAKQIIIDNIIIEKEIDSITLESVSEDEDIVKIFFAMYHFFVSENMRHDRILSSYTHRSKRVTRRRYNILEKELAVNSSDKKEFVFSSKSQLRQLLYSFDERVNSFLISDIYAYDTLGNKYELKNKEKQIFIKSSIVNGSIINVFINGYCSDSIEWLCSCRLRRLYFYHLSHNRAEFDSDINFSSKAFSGYLKTEDDDLQEDIEKYLLSEDLVLEKDNELIFKALQPPLTDEELNDIRTRFHKDELTIEYLRKLTVKESKKFKKAIESSQQAGLI
jgi:hypothetical protein